MSPIRFRKALTGTRFTPWAIDTCDQAPPAPTCARCGAVLCGCSDTHWKG